MHASVRACMRAFEGSSAPQRAGCRRQSASLRCTRRPIRPLLLRPLPRAPPPKKKHTPTSLLAATPGGAVATGSTRSTPLLARTRAAWPAATYALRSGTRSRDTSTLSTSDATPGARSSRLAR